VATFAEAASHEEVRYSQVWEDHALVTDALVVEPGDTVLSLAGAGCNVLALLLEDPASIVAVDVSPAQVALLELKLAAIRGLTDAGELAALLGARPGADRAATYARLRSSLPADARSYWDGRPDVVRDGVIGCGMLDRYVSAFVQRYVRALVDEGAVRRFLGANDLEAQRTQWAAGVTAIEPAVREWFGRSGLSGRARDETQFAHVGDVDVGAWFWRRFEEVSTTVPARGNFYLEWLLTGGYASLDSGPPWLRPANFELLRSRVDRVTVVRDELGSFLRGVDPESFAAANLSDLFEYLPDDHVRDLMGQLRSCLRPGGRIAYWNLFVERSAEGVEGFAPVDGLGASLFARDRVPFYGAFRVEARV
jgi:S-adenosylmethionine-diacylglycerol 3-amino-3-carboxypropyl transferase